MPLMEKPKAEAAPCAAVPLKPPRMGVPRLFALTRRGDDSGQQVVGYGMELPDGSAYSASWPTPGGSICSASSAEETADLGW